jgi:homoserine kinase
VYGEGEEDLPRDGSHLVVKAIRSGLHAANAEAPGLRVVCTNAIPQSRGLGSSAAAAVAGVAAANALAGSPLTSEQIVQLSSAFEGHPDNAAASVLGSAVVSWTTTPVDGSQPGYRAVAVDVDPRIRATALVPDFHASTQAVRRVLPSHVTHTDARFNVSRVAVMTVALQNHPELLWEGTRDRLHQPYRADVLPVTAEWVNRLRNRGYAAYLSGAGPTVMVLSVDPVEGKILDQAREDGLKVHELEVAGPVRVETSRA